VVFAELTARYLETAARGDGMKRGEALAPRTLDEYRRVLKADVLPALGGIAPGERASRGRRAAAHGSDSGSCLGSPGCPEDS
jgi:hypothetical protein